MKKFFEKQLKLLIAALLVFSSFERVTVFAEEPEDDVVVSWGVTENDAERVSSKLEGLDNSEEEDASLAKEEVRVSILLEENSALAQGYDVEGIGKNPSAMAYRDSLKELQEEVAEEISKEVLGEELDVEWNLTLAANIISANVTYEDVEEIKNVDGVADVIIENQYFPDVYEVNEDDPNMSTATEMTSAQYAWAEGYTGAGRLVAIVDTGIDTEHQSFNSYAFDMAIQDVRSKTGKDVRLLTQKDVNRFWASLNASEVSSGASTDAYVSSKLPFAFNYVDGDFDVTHLNDTQGEHGSHVASIAAANRFIYSESEDGSVSLKNAVTEVSTQGNAPDAQVLVMKVFGKGGGAYDSDYFAAIEDAIVLGADSVNLSLGSSSAGFSKNSTYQDIIDSIPNVNIVWANSAGNNGSWADNTPLGYLYSDGNNFASGGSPATYSSTMSVASVDNKGFTGSYLEYNGNLLFYTESAYKNEAISTIAGTYDFVYVDGVGTDEQFAAVKDMLEGKIAICNRGETSFYQKAEAAVANGAIATVIVNNQPGTINMNLADYKQTQPCVSITQADGQLIKDSAEAQVVEELNVYTGSITVADEIATTVNESEYYTMSDFSSYGVPGSLNLKPEITTPGGNIYAAFGLNKTETGAMAGGHDKYENMSGTSMAAPQLAGQVALMNQFIEENDLEKVAERLGITRRALIQSMLMSTAKPLVDEASGSYYSVLVQGSGLVDLQSAFNSNVVVLMNDTNVNGTRKMNVSSYAKDGKVKAELGDDPNRTGSYFVEFTLNNMTDEERYFDLSGDFFTQDIFPYGDHEYVDTWTTPLQAGLTWYLNGEKFVAEEVTYNFNNDEDGVYDSKDAQAILDYVVGNREEIGDAEAADLDGDGTLTTYDAYLALKLANKAVTVVPANGTVTVGVNVQLGDDVANYDVNGAYVEGYLYATEKESQDGALGVAHSIPVLGYYGGWGEASSLDVGSLVEYKYELETREPYMSVDSALGKDAKEKYATAFTAKHTAFNADFALGGNPLGAAFDDGKYWEERNAFSSNNELTGAQYTLTRNAAARKYALVDGEGNVVNEKEDVADMYAAYYYANQGEWRNVRTSSKYSYDLKEVEEGTNLKLQLSLAPEYFVDAEGKVNWDEVNPSYELPFVIDNTVPEVTSVFGKRIVEERKVTNEETGEETTETMNNIIVTVSASDNEYIAGMFVYDEEDNLVYSEGSRDTAKRGAKDNGDYVVALDGTKISDHLYVEVWDYAANVTTVQINLNKDELEDEVGITLNESKVNSAVGGKVVLKASITPWGTKDQTVTWTSSDESVATVVDGVVTGLSEGTVTITATANADPTKSATCEVTFVVIDRDLNGVVWDENGDVYVSEFNTRPLPEYTKLSDNLKLPIASLMYNPGGGMLAASFDSDEWKSTLYAVNEETFEFEAIGDSSIGYMDMAPAPSLGENVALAVYGPYVVIVNTATGDYEGVFNYESQTNGNYLVGIAYEEQFAHPSYGNTDWYFFIDEAGNLYENGYLTMNGRNYQFGVTKMGNLGYSADVPYFQSLYYDGTDLYWCNFNEGDGKVDLVFVNDIYADGSIYNLGSFEQDVWPVGGLYNEAQKELIGYASNEDEGNKNREIDTSVELESTVTPLEVRAGTRHKGTTNTASNYTTNRVLKKASPAESEEEGVVVVEVTADAATTNFEGEAVQHNGLYEVTYNTEELELVSAKSDEAFQAFNNSDGTVAFGFVNNEGVKENDVVATLTFTRKTKEKVVVNVNNNEVENNFEGNAEEVVFERAIFDISDATVEGVVDKVYTGEEVTQDVSVVLNDKTLVEGTDYTVDYDNNVNVGKATVTVTGTGNYEGTVSKSFNITAQSVSEATVSGLGNKTYTGKAIEPTPTVKVGDTTLKSGTDYTVAYDNNINVGKATVTITGKGNYTGKLDVTFNIVANTKVTLNKTNVTLGTKKVGSYVTTVQLKATVTGHNNTKVTWTSSNPKVAKVDANGKVTAVSDPNHLATTVTITAKTVDGKTATCKVTVEDPVSAFVRRLYKYCLNRNPDATGFKYWTDALRSKKMTAADVVKGFFDSNEMKNKKLSNAEVIERCYLVMLNRKSDASGKKYWESVYKSKGRLEVLKGFVNSNEFTQICKDYGVVKGSIK